MDAEPYDEFLEKYAAGQHSEQEHRAFQQWLMRATPAQVQVALDRYAELQRYRLPLMPAPADVAALEARLDSLAARPQRTRRWLSAAAMAGLGLLGGLGYLLRPAAPAVVYRLHRTSQGQQARLTLPDGSVVRLNGSSSLRYPVVFGAATREVYLRGEAYFEVAKDRVHPFVVHSGRLQTRVVGTSFDVYAYAPAERLEVTVLTGRVLVTDSATGHRVALRPAQKAILVPAATVLHREAAPHPQLSLAWRQGRLRFEQAPLAEITAKLSQRYGVHIGLGSERLRQCRLTVEFGPESLAEALEILTALTGSTYSQQHQQIILVGLGC